MLRVAYLTGEYPKVSHTFIRREIRALEQLGVVVERFSLRSPGDLVDGEDLQERAKTSVVVDGGAIRLVAAAGSTALRSPLRFARSLVTAIRMGLRSDRGVARNVGYLLSACVMKDELRRRDIEHLHVHFGTNPAAVAMLCRELGGPGFSFTAHGCEEWDKPWSLSLPQKIAGAKFVTGVCSFGRGQLYRHTAPSRWPHVHVVRCGVDRAYLDDPPPLIPDVPRLVHVGRLCSEKGQLHLVSAAAALARRGVDFQLVLVGDGEMRAEVEDAIRREGLSHCISITGWSTGEDVKRHLTDARAFVLPSFVEGMPVVIMEALAMGRPVISTYVGGVPELVENGKTGWLVPAGSLEPLVDAMQAALSTPVSRLEQMGLEGRRRVARQHDVEVSARRLHQLLNRYVASDPDPVAS